MQPGQQMHPTVPQQDVEMGIPMQPQPAMVQQPVLIQQQTIPVNVQQNIGVAGEPVVVSNPEQVAFDKANNV